MVISVAACTTLSTAAVPLEVHSDAARGTQAGSMQPGGHLLSFWVAWQLSAHAPPPTQAYELASPLQSRPCLGMDLMLLLIYSDSDSASTT